MSDIVGKIEWDQVLKKILTRVDLKESDCEVGQGDEEALTRLSLKLQEHNGSNKHDLKGVSSSSTIHTDGKEHDSDADENNSDDEEDRGKTERDFVYKRSSVK